MLQSCQNHGVSIIKLPSYALESNKVSELLVEERWTRARVLLLSFSIPQNLVAETFNHAKLAENRFPCFSINNKIPHMVWDVSLKINFGRLYPLKTVGFSFINYSPMVKKIASGSEYSCFVGMDSDERLTRIYLPDSKSIREVFLSDFHALRSNKLPSTSSLVDGFYKQAKIVFQGVQKIQSDEQLQSYLSKTPLTKAYFPMSNTS